VLPLLALLLCLPVFTLNLNKYNQKSIQCMKDLEGKAGRRAVRQLCPNPMILTLVEQNTWPPKVAIASVETKWAAEGQCTVLPTDAKSHSDSGPM